LAGNERKKITEGKMDDLYVYMKAKLKELQDTRSETVEIDCVEFMQLLKMLCYMMQIRRIVDDDA
jgi:hypothetical protein